MQANKELSEIEDWDKTWRAHQLPQIFKTEYHPYYVDVLDKFFHKYLPVDKNLDVIELGCSPGRWLHYFHKEFGYSVSGLDNSALGVEMTKKNLELLGVRGDIYLGDVRDFQPPRKFDVVLSFGLIEHFEDTQTIIKKHLDFLKPGGYLIIYVPNLFTPFYKTVQILIDKHWFDIHKTVSPADLTSISKELGLQMLFCGFVGVFNLYMLGIYADRKFLHWLIRWLQTIADKILRKFKIERESKLFSPYVFLVARNK